MDARIQIALAVVAGASLLGSAVFLGLISRAGRDMRASGGPGIVPFELAESTREATRHMRTWGKPGRAAAGRSIRWDFGFIATYVPLLLSSALQVAARANDAGYGVLVVLEVVAAGSAVVAGVLNGIENITLLRQLRTVEATRRTVRLARTCARAKFRLVGAVGIAILVGLGVTELSGRATAGAADAAVLVVVLAAAGVYAAVTLTGSRAR